MKSSPHDERDKGVNAASAHMFDAILKLLRSARPAAIHFPEAAALRRTTLLANYADSSAADSLKVRLQHQEDFEKEIERFSIERPGASVEELIELYRLAKVPPEPDDEPASPKGKKKKKPKKATKKLEFGLEPPSPSKFRPAKRTATVPPDEHSIEDFVEELFEPDDNIEDIDSDENIEEEPAETEPASREEIAELLNAGITKFQEEMTNNYDFSEDDKAKIIKYAQTVSTDRYAVTVIDPDGKRIYGPFYGNNLSRITADAQKLVPELSNFSSSLSKKFGAGTYSRHTMKNKYAVHGYMNVPEATTTQRGYFSLLWSTRALIFRGLVTPLKKI